jgi:hypothetical protein
LRVPDSWDARISQRIQERIEVIQRTMTLAGLGEDYREMLLGEVADRIDPARWFSKSLAGQDASDAMLDGWIREAAGSVQRLQQLLGDSAGFNGDASAFRPTLTGDDFKLAFALALERHGLRLQETRNSANQFVPGVHHFRLPDAFRDPVFRPERTFHVVFDREVFQRVRDEDLGRVRGQPIRPALAGFGEPVTDWLFQSAMQARPTESAFALRVGEGWPHGAGWLCVFALRWFGPARRLMTPDSLAPVFVGLNGTPQLVEVSELLRLAAWAEAASTAAEHSVRPPVMAEATRFAQQILRECVTRRDLAARGGAGLSLWLCARIKVPSAF